MNIKSPRPRRETPQRHGSQQYDHTQQYSLACVKCGNDYSRKNCIKPRNVEPTVIPHDIATTIVPDPQSELRDRSNISLKLKFGKLLKS